ncbi:MAG TPA: response regulator [Gemmatimonadales bacterium]|nr:response regulator [Gemmatimonadales bacterium]
MPEPSETILVVDDNEAERYYVARVLRREGFDVSEAGTGQDALRLAAAAPNLITLDVRLPDLSGFEVCRRLKNDPATRDIPVLHISASYTTPDAKAEGLDGGADGYLTHPVDPTELVATVRALLRARHAEVLVRAAAREWTTTFDLISDAVCLTGEGERIVRCNAAFARLMERPYTGLIGMPLGELVPELKGSGSVLTASPRVLRIADRHYRVSAAPEPGRESPATSRAWVFGDVTERERQQEALRRSEEEAQARLTEIEAMYRAAPVGLCVLDADLRYVRINQQLADWNGVPVEAHLGRTVREVLPALADVVEPRMREILRTGQPMIGFEVRGETPAQPGVERVWVETWYPLLAPDGRIVGINIAADEVTEQRRLQEQLHEAQRLEAVGRLAGGVAHEANNQMTVVPGCASFVLRHPDMPEPVRGDVEQIRRAAERTARITAQLLAFGRRQHLRPEEVELDSIITRLQPILARTLGDRSALVIETGARGRRVQADVGQIEQVLLNLTLNARDAMPAGGTLTVRTTLLEVDSDLPGATVSDELPPGPYIGLSVADTGHGMDAATLQRAFEPFFTTKGPGKGTGLGLSMVYGVVRQSGGHIRALSTPGQGTRVEIYLPSVSSAEPLPASSAAAASAGAYSGRVLLAEDDPLVREVIVRELQIHGYEVAEAADGQEALERLGKEPNGFDVVITDLAMPRMDGHELAQQLTEAHPRLPILLISGHPDEAVAGQPSQSPRPFLQKPFAAEELLAHLRELLRRST